MSYDAPCPRLVSIQWTFSIACNSSEVGSLHFDDVLSPEPTQVISGHL